MFRQTSSKSTCLTEAGSDPPWSFHPSLQQALKEAIANGRVEAIVPCNHPCSQHSSAAQKRVTTCRNGFWRICCNDVLRQGRTQRCILAMNLSHARLCCKQFYWCSHCEKPRKTVLTDSSSEKTHRGDALRAGKRRKRRIRSAECR